ncbi:M3 family oligoendopeptidase [Bacillus suaedae]|uniref:M3 family oligoendopeptidase n=1 Tax=Halalkalibacter suaedae TaxID=2822140 RepID=A0A940WXX8_9BACI|nr:M3 family oligoendopeptidase [Bacillus suaedae]MBP3950430.1 M3 family oligoendopeptidase [Bacillus suaedae]
MGFYKEVFDFSNRNVLESQFVELLNEEIISVEQLETWLKKQSALYDGIEEGISGHYIDFQCHSNSKEAKEKFEYDQQQVEPLVKKYVSLLDEKFLSTEARHQLNEEYYQLFIKSKQNSKELFREENINLEVKEDELATSYFEITGSQTVQWNGEELTLSQLSPYLQDSNRDIRKQALTLMAESFIEKENELQDIMDQLIAIRQQKAENAGLDNYRDYMFKKYERFDYTPADCKRLAEAIQTHVKPLKEKLQRKHQSELAVDTYRPWDRAGVRVGQTPLKPFENTDELVEKSATIFNNLDPRFAELLTTMNNKQMLDLNSRKGKAPGGFCSPLPVSELSFIFMNASRTHDDMITLLHEMGHCIHNDLKKELPLNDYRETPMESSELASMSMELLTMDQWQIFYQNEQDLKRAKIEQLKGIIEFLPQGMVIDQFQHWLYENPTHTAEQRNEKYRELMHSIDSETVDWTGYEKWAKTNWLKVLHIFEVPFYYIEYVIAQLGAVQLYKQYRENPDEALTNYKHALSLGASKSLPEIYEAAGIKFDFSEEMIKELMIFLEGELDKLV